MHRQLEFLRYDGGVLVADVLCQRGGRGLGREVPLRRAVVAQSLAPGVGGEVAPDGACGLMGERLLARFGPVGEASSFTMRPLALLSDDSSMLSRVRLLEGVEREGEGEGVCGGEGEGEDEMRGGCSSLMLAVWQMDG